MLNGFYKSSVGKAMVFGLALGLIMPCAQASTFTFPSNGGILDSETGMGE